MITVLFTLSIVVGGALLVLASLMQRAYQESQRLRLKDAAFLDAFHDHLEERIGVRAEEGAMAFSLAKHTLLVMLVAAVSLVTAPGERSFWLVGLEVLGTSLALMFLCVYLLPPLLFQRVSGRWITALLPACMAIIWVFRPLRFFLDFFESLASIGKQHGEASENSTQEEHLEAFMEAGAEEGLIEEEDRKLIRSVVEFGDKTVREVMTSRNKMVVVEANQTLDALRSLVIDAQLSRFPVYEGDLDHIIGFVHVRDVFEVDEKDLARRQVRELMRPVRMVPESKPVNTLLREMQGDGAHMVIVVSEYGETAGLATLEDLMEEIFGEIRDEHEPDPDVVSDGSGAFIVQGAMDVDRLEELVGYRPEDDAESTTVGGLLAEWAGHVPRVGEVIEEDGLRMEVMEGNELRVDKVRIRRVALTSTEGVPNGG
jgi:CBS domain containing-hemolysin-like protein